MRGTLALALAALLAVASRAPAQDGSGSRAADSEQALRISPSLSFREITLVLKNGTVIWGRLVGAGAEAVRVRQEGEDLDVPFRDLRKVVIKREKNAFASKGVASGMALGFYVGSGLMLRAFEGPGFYLPGGGIHVNYAYFLFVNALFGATGGALGWMAGSGSRDKAFTFPEEPEGGRESWELFIRYLGGEPQPARLHLIVQGGLVDLRVSRGFDTALREAGSLPDNASPLRSNFCYLRSVNLAYSFKSRWQAGIRLSFLSEPDRIAFSYDEVSFLQTTFRQRFRATACYGIVSLEPLRLKAAGRLTWNVGLGFGLAAVRLLRQGNEYGGDAPVEEAAEVKKTLLSAVAFSTLEFRLTRSLSAGIAGDYAFIPAAAVPALPRFGLPAQGLGLGNASAGFVLGLHF